MSDRKDLIERCTTDELQPIHSTHALDIYVKRTALAKAASHRATGSHGTSHPPEGTSSTPQRESFPGIL
jgi:hypothetical protein